MQTTIFKINALPLEKLIEEKVNNNSWLIGEMEDKPSNWTSAVNILFKDVAKSIHKDCLVACKQFDIRDSAEWLYDFVCYTENETGLDQVHFVAESQWMNQWHKERNYDDIKYDFEKLLIARCEIRIMVFEANNEEEIISYITALNSIVANSKITQINDRYLYLGWNCCTEDFYVDLYIRK